MHPSTCWRGVLVWADTSTPRQQVELLFSPEVSRFTDCMLAVDGSGTWLEQFPVGETFLKIGSYPGKML